MKWPALVFIINLKNQSYQEMLEKTNKIHKNLDISAMYFIINNKETRIKQNSTIKKLSNKDNMYIIVDENKEINKIIRNNCVETDSEIPFLMYVNNQTIKWAKFAYNSNNFEEVINTVINSWKK